jgi:hypothetical protein
MLKSSPIFKRNGTHLVENKYVYKNIKIIHSWGLSALNMQKHFLFVSNYEYVNFAINKKYFKSIYRNPNYYASLVIFQIQKCNFKKCPLILVAPLTLFLLHCNQIKDYFHVDH